MGLTNEGPGQKDGYIHPVFRVDRQVDPQVSYGGSGKVRPGRARRTSNNQIIWRYIVKYIITI